MNTFGIDQPVIGVPEPIPVSLGTCRFRRVVPKETWERFARGDRIKVHMVITEDGGGYFAWKDVIDYDTFKKLVELVQGRKTRRG